MSEPNVHPRITSVIRRLGLTKRQSEVLERVATGTDLKQLSSEMYISTATARTHLRDIFRTLRFRSRTELVAKILADVLSEVDRESGIVPEDEDLASSPTSTRLPWQGSTVSVKARTE